MAKSKKKKKEAPEQSHLRLVISDTSALDVYLSEYRGKKGITIQRMYKKRDDPQSADFRHGKRMFFSLEETVETDDMPTSEADFLVNVMAGLIGEHHS